MMHCYSGNCSLDSLPIFLGEPEVTFALQFSVSIASNCFSARDFTQASQDIANPLKNDAGKTIE